MLRRTNAKQVVPVFLDVIREYPTPTALANAKPHKIRRMLKQLGLAWRTENVIDMGKMLVHKYRGRVPSNYEELRRLPGVGDYVASAVCSFAFDEPRAVIDTNTVRVVGRYFGFPTHAESRRNNFVRDAIRAVTDVNNPRLFNQAFLDFGSIVCTAINPKCVSCPLRTNCIEGQKRLARRNHA